MGGRDGEGDIADQNDENWWEEMGGCSMTAVWE